MKRKSGAKKKEETPKSRRYKLAAWIVGVLIPGYHIAQNPNRKKSAQENQTELELAPAAQEVGDGQ